MSERRITISPKVDRRIYFRFKDLCHAHGIAVERGVEQAMKDVLDRAGYFVDEIVHDGSSLMVPLWQLSMTELPMTAEAPVILMCTGKDDSFRVVVEVGPLTRASFSEG